MNCAGHLTSPAWRSGLGRDGRLENRTGLATGAIDSRGLFIPGSDRDGNIGFGGKHLRATIGRTISLFSCGGASTVGATTVSGTAGHTDAFDWEFSLPLTLMQEVPDRVLSNGGPASACFSGRACRRSSAVTS